MKCFQCIKEEYHKKRRWSQVADAVTILQGNTYCYEHLKNELGWDDKHTEVKK